MNAKARRRPLLYAGVSTLLLFGLSACSLYKYDSPDRPTAEALAGAEVFLKGLLRDELRYDSPLGMTSAREESCLDRVKNDNWNRATRIRTDTEGEYPDYESAQADMDTIQAYLEEQGWILDREDHGGRDSSYVNVLVYDKGDLSFVGSHEYDEYDGRRTVDFTITTECAKQDKGHEMVRSKLDPDYSLNTQYYDYEKEEANPRKDGEGSLVLRDE